jgi:hypothetical protein
MMIKGVIGRFAIIVTQNGVELDGLIAAVDSSGRADIKLSNSGPTEVTFKSVPYSEKVPKRISPMPPNARYRAVCWRFKFPSKTVNSYMGG